jgi:hypothetical protein
VSVFKPLYKLTGTGVFRVADPEIVGIAAEFRLSIPLIAVVLK